MLEEHNLSRMSFGSDMIHILNGKKQNNQDNKDSQ